MGLEIFHCQNHHLTTTTSSTTTTKSYSASFPFPSVPDPCSLFFDESELGATRSWHRGYEPRCRAALFRDFPLKHRRVHSQAKLASLRMRLYQPGVVLGTQMGGAYSSRVCFSQRDISSSPRAGLGFIVFSHSSVVFAHTYTLLHIQSGFNNHWRYTMGNSWEDGPMIVTYLPLISPDVLWKRRK